jgi:hypothetical protein
MDDVFRIMCDVAGLVTRGSDAARIEARRIAAQREEGAAASGLVEADQSRNAAGAQPAERGAARLRRWFRLALVAR